jgi:N-acyl-D-amino-acid deacylase
MAAGAVGFSTGLYYPPNRAAPIDEVVALLEVAGRTGAIYTTHMRNEGDGVEDSLEESFETARRAGVDLVISHHKCEGTQNFGRSEKTLRRIDEARARQPVGLDVYPYAASSTVLLPEFVDDGLRIIVTWSKSHPEASGRDLSIVAQEWGISQREAAKRLAPAGAIYFRMDEADVQRILAYPHTMVGSDGLPHDEHPHPRLWGTFPRVLGHYVRELQLLSLEDAVRKMTGLTAERFGLADRGTLKAGAFADLVLFAPDTVIDRATFEAPRQAAAGIELVMVNGDVTYGEGAATGAAPGRMLLKAA